MISRSFDQFASFWTIYAASDMLNTGHSMM